MTTAATRQPRIVSGGGPITSDSHQAFWSAGTSASEDWVRGEILAIDRLSLCLVRLGRAEEAQERVSDYFKAFRLDSTHAQAATIHKQIVMELI